MKQGRRGLTLLELLAAAVLLSLLAMIIAPILRDTSRLLQETDRAPGLCDEYELRQFSTGVLSQPKLHGIENPEGRQALAIQGPEVGKTVTVRAQPVKSLDSDWPYRWIIFECEGTGVVRWIAAPTREAE